MSANSEFTRPDGKRCPNYYTEPKDAANAPGIVVMQEWWGLNEQIEAVANHLAEAGYRVMVPDLYRGEITLDAAEAEHHMNALDFGDAATQDLRGAVQALKAKGGKVGVIGFCMGGVLAALAAMHVPETDVVVDWYGVPPEGAGDPSTVRIPFQAHFALRDEFFPIEQADALEAKLKATGIPLECYRYDAHHAFGNETGQNYNAEAAKAAWDRSLAFLNKYLKAG